MPSGRSGCRWAPVRAYVLIANDDGIAYVGEAQNGFQNMMLLDKWRENEDRVRQAGTIALKQARVYSWNAFDMTIAAEEKSEALGM